MWYSQITPAPANRCSAAVAAECFATYPAIRCHKEPARPAHIGRVECRGDFNLRTVKVDTDAIRSFFLIIIFSRCRRVWLKAETVQRHTRWDQIINRQIKSHDRCQMSRLVERGTQGKVMTVLRAGRRMLEKLSRSSRALACCNISARRESTMSLTVDSLNPEVRSLRGRVEISTRLLS